MTVHTIYLSGATGLTLNAFPDSEDLDDWSSLKVAGSAGSSPNAGRYSFSLDDANGTQWTVFEGASQPSSWTTYFAKVALDSGGSSSSSGTIVIPVVGVVAATVDGSTIRLSTGDSAATVTVATVDSNLDAVDCSGLTLQVVIESLDKTDATTIADGSITKTTTTVAFAVPSSVRAAERTWRWSLRNTSNDVAIMGGYLYVQYAPEAD